jgi:preprotein translocase subunit SecF
MKKVIRFTRVRIYMFILSVLLIAAGIAAIIINDGFNLGIDFQAGMNLRVQIADPVMSVTYDGEGDATANVTGNSVVIQREGIEESGRITIPLADNPTIGELASSIEEVPGISAVVVGGEGLPTELIVGFSHIRELGEAPVYINARPESEDTMFAPIEEIRQSVAGLGGAQIQIVGDSVNQEYIIRVEDPGSEDDFSSKAADRIMNLLGERFGEASVIQKQTDYVGPRFSRELTQQVVLLTVFALLLILVYIWFRFRLAYAVSAIIALAHDVAIILGFVAAFQIEFSTATIAAILTIIGYSLNDTIVIFDRVRENVGLMRDSDFQTIINSSITQSLSRTLLTSLTTILGVAAIYIFGTGSIKDFALSLMVGIVIGTYSSMFVASPILLGWTNLQTKRKKMKDLQKYGRGETPKAPTGEKGPEQAATNETLEAEKAGEAKTEKGEKGEIKPPSTPVPKERKPQGKKRTKSGKKKKKKK